MKYQKLLTTILLATTIGISPVVLAQHEPEEKHVEHEKRHADYKNMVAVKFGYTHVPGGSELHHSEAKGVYVPTIGVDYGREIHTKRGRRFELGIMLDWELDHYIIADKELERERAFIAVGGLAFNPVAHLVLFMGAGIEIEQNKNLFVWRSGLDYNFRVGKRWGIVPTFNFDWKEEYGSFSFAIGLKYKF